MRVVEYLLGNAVRIAYLDCGQKKYDLETFLDDIERTRPNEFNQLASLLDKTAKYGPVWNNYRTSRLQGKAAQPLCEFCSSKECRIFWFFDDQNDKLIICTHGFVARGKHDHRNEIERGQKRRAMYYEYKRNASGHRNELEA